MTTKCPNCSKTIHASKVLCHDWQDPNKAYGCPNCKIFYVKSLTNTVSPEVVGPMVAVGISLPAFQTIFYGIQNDQTSLIVNGSMILFSLAALGLYYLFPRGRELLRSPYQPFHDIPSSENKTNT